jgi:hypothetical protein
MRCEHDSLCRQKRPGSVWIGRIVRVAAHELQMTLGLRSYVHGASHPIVHVR